jgi:hypothetical protein
MPLNPRVIDIFDPALDLRLPCRRKLEVIGGLGIEQDSKRFLLIRRKRPYLLNQFLNATHADIVPARPQQAGSQPVAPVTGLACGMSEGNKPDVRAVSIHKYTREYGEAPMRTDRVPRSPGLPE